MLPYGHICQNVSIFRMADYLLSLHAVRENTLRTDKYADNTYHCCNFSITVWKDNI